MTSDPDFKVITFFEVEYRKKGAAYKVAIAQEETVPNIWNGTMFVDLDWPKRVAWVCQLSFLIGLTRLAYKSRR